MCRHDSETAMSRIPAPTLNIAIVDDDQAVGRAMARLISAHSFRVQWYASARAFLSSLEAETPDCLILDLQMSEMTGLELLTHLSGMGLRIPTIVISAHDEPGLRHRCKLAGAFSSVDKPVTRERLLFEIAGATASAERMSGP